MQLRGSINQIKSRVNASGDTINTVSLEVFGDVELLHSLLKKSLLIDLKEMEG